MAYIRFASFGAILVSLACDSDTFRLDLPPEQVAAEVRPDAGASEPGPSTEEVAEPKEAGEPGEKEPETGPTAVAAVVSDAGGPADAAVDAGGVADAGTGDGDAGPPLGDGAAATPDELVVAVGAGNTCVLRGGLAECWGDNAFGQSSPPDVEFSAFGLGNTHGCGLAPNGVPHCWGNNEDGRATPTGVRFSSLAVGSSHACGLDANGRAVCWGRSTGGRAAPPPNITFDAIAVGGPFACGLSAGRIACWGNIPAPPKGNFAAITAGDGHACALDAAGRATCWGSDAFGQSAPPALAFSALSAGNGHTCGLADGQVTCWGAIEAPPEGTSGELAQGPGAGHACAASGGQIQCWGANRDGQTDVPASLKGL